ncbi:M15 family metallopeptidase [Demequina iriomotensis]|uniref:M15 family metallopeptidase n=1 Tax=Demequina iriomotensis TaxID=1536641 RepID=UPI000A462656|nr:M15 family metallopeptidase [Demequina iriomotensis]
MSKRGAFHAPRSTQPSRRERRVEHTQEIQVRTSMRRRRLATRGGVLLGFLAAMVVYPVMGTIAPYANAAEQLPGVVKGESPTTATAILGAGPQFESSDLPLPTVDEQSGAILTSADVPVASSLLPDCDPNFDTNVANGQLTSDQLCSLWVAGESLRPDAALAFAALNERFKTEFGVDICISDTYRDLAGQYATKASRGYLAAAPGTSMHGLGLAVDLCRSHASGVYYSWFARNAATYGFWNPDWAKTSKYEPWHWEYMTYDRY